MTPREGLSTSLADAAGRVETRPRRRGFGIARRFGYAGPRMFRRRQAAGRACLEDSPSGLWRTPGTRVGFTPSGVQIPHPPPM